MVKDVRVFQIELGFGGVAVCGWRKTGEPGEKTLDIDLYSLQFF